jgi:hypothetical protein
MKHTLRMTNMDKDELISKKNKSSAIKQIDIKMYVTFYRTQKVKNSNTVP